MQKLNYQYLTTRVAVVLVVRGYFNGSLVLFCVQCCVCRKRLSSPRCRSELIDSAWVVIVPGQKCIKKKWTFACNRENFKFGKYNVVCSNHFEYGRPTAVSPVPTLCLKGYDDESSHAVKRKSPAKRSAPLGGKKSKIIYSSPLKDVNDSTIIDFEVISVDIDVDATSTPHC